MTLYYIESSLDPGLLYFRLVLQRYRPAIRGDTSVGVSYWCESNVVKRWLYGLAENMRGVPKFKEVIRSAFKPLRCPAAPVRKQPR